MKKLSVEEKAKRYDEAIVKLRGMMPNWERLSYNGKTFLQDLIHILPELKESEDELTWLKRFIEEEIDCLSFDIRDSEDRVKLKNLQRSISWLEKLGETFTKKDVDDAYLKGMCDAKHELEKQSEQNTIVVIPKFRVGDVIRPKGSTAEYTIESISGECYYGKEWGLHISCDDDYELVEQKTNDKVEPKFNVGAWVVFDEKHESVYQIEKIENFQYTLRHILGGLMPLSFSREDMIRAWTIQDAKAGDVLVTGNKNIFIFKSISDCTIYDYCGLYFGKFWEEPATVNGTTAVQLPIDCVPATKEQRDTLIKAMTDAGYTFDFEKKELKKIEQKPAETEKGAKGNDREIPNCAWSEEDEAMLNFVKVVLSKHQNDELFDKSETTLNDCLSWFKDIKDRVGCKADCTTTKEWSGEDEEMLTKFLHKVEVCDLLTNRESVWVTKRLKSLRPQNRWKPTEEQLKSLARAGNRCISVDDAKILTKLLEQLKKL